MSARAQKRLDVLLYFYTHDTSVSATCRHFGINRSTFYRLTERFDVADWTTLEDAPSAARPAAATANEQTAELIAQYRRSHPYAGAKKIAKMLQNEHGIEATPDCIDREIRSRRLYFGNSPLHARRQRMSADQLHAVPAAAAASHTEHTIQSRTHVPDAHAHEHASPAIHTIKASPVRFAATLASVFVVCFMVAIAASAVLESNLLKTDTTDNAAAMLHTCTAEMNANLLRMRSDATGEERREQHLTALTTCLRTVRTMPGSPLPATLTDEGVREAAEFMEECMSAFVERFSDMGAGTDTTHDLEQAATGSCMNALADMQRLHSNLLSTLR